MEEAAFLLAMKRIVCGIEIQHDRAWRLRTVGEVSLRPPRGCFVPSAAPPFRRAVEAVEPRRRRSASPGESPCPAATVQLFSREEIAPFLLGARPLRPWVAGVVRPSRGGPNAALDRLRLRWVEDRVAAGLSEHEQARQPRRSVRQTFLRSAERVEALRSDSYQ